MKYGNFCRNAGLSQSDDERISRNFDKEPHRVICVSTQSKNKSKLDKIKADAFLPVVHVIFKVDVHSLRSLMSFKIAELAFDYNRQSRPPFTIGHILPTQMFSAIVSI